MNESRILELSKELDTTARGATAISQKYAAHLTLHTAAVMEGDKEQMLEHRQAAHVLLDRLFDNGERVQELTNELRRLMQDG